MLEKLLGAIAALGTPGVQNTLVSAGESVGRKFKDAYSWKCLLVGTGDFFIKNFGHIFIPFFIDF